MKELHAQAKSHMARGHTYDAMECLLEAENYNTVNHHFSYLPLSERLAEHVTFRSSPKPEGQ